MRMTEPGKYTFSFAHHLRFTISFGTLTLCFLLVLVPKAGAKLQTIQTKDTAGSGQANSSFQRHMELRVSSELENNRIGADYGSDHPGSETGIYDLGLKWVRLGFWDSSLNWQQVEHSLGAYSVPAERDTFVRNMVENGVTVVLSLTAGSGKGRPDQTRFKNDRDILRYANYVRFMVAHFKPFIKYYEIWNEPGTNSPWGRIDVDDYARLIHHVVPVIREEHSEAKIVIGATGGSWVSNYPGYGTSSRYTLDLEYLEALLRSGVAPLVDVISWHPFYGHRPDDPYYQHYPEMVKKLKQTAEAQGFNGEYVAEEMLWRTESADEPQQPVSEVVSAKYLARAIVTNLGLDVTASVSGMFPGKTRDFVRRLCTLMAGARSIRLPVQIQSDTSDIKHYGFSLSNGDSLLAIWTDGVAVEAESSVPVKIVLRGFSTKLVLAVDIRTGLKQAVDVSIQDGNLTIQNLLVKDYPTILHFAR